MRPNLTLTYGIRADVPTFPEKPTANPLTVSALGLKTDEVPSGCSGRRASESTTPCPRIVVSRSGVALGSSPVAHRMCGCPIIRQYRDRVPPPDQAFNVNNRIPFVSDPNAQPTSVGSAATNEIDLIDPDYKYPSLLRTNIAYDRELGFLGLVGTTEFLYSQNVNDIAYQNLNLVPASARPDGRTVYTRNRVAGLSDVIFLTNTDQGDAWSVVFKVDRPYRNRLFMSASYLFGRSTSILDGTSSQAASNWGNTYISLDANNPPLTRVELRPGPSDHDVGRLRCPGARWHQHRGIGLL